MLPSADQLPEAWGTIIQARYNLAQGVWVLLMRDTGAFVGPENTTRVAAWDPGTSYFTSVSRHTSVLSAHAVFASRANAS